MRRNAGGFTLFEVIVALAIGGVVVLLAHGVFAGVADGGRALVAAREQIDREANARRWLKVALLSLDVGSEDGGGSFTGRPDRLEFGTWLQAPGGWLERERIQLVMEGNRFVAAGMGAGSIVLVDSVAGVAFDYLLDPGADTRWVREWISPVSAPLAVRLRIQRRAGVDTLLLLIKERG